MRGNDPKHGTSDPARTVSLDDEAAVREVLVDTLFGLWSTVATSDMNEPFIGDEWYEDVYGNLFINNANDFDVALHIRPLRADLAIDSDPPLNDLQVRNRPRVPPPPQIESEEAERRGPEGQA